MQSLAYLLPLSALSVVAQALAPSPLRVDSAVLAEQRSTAADGSVRVTLAPVKRAVPGDRVVFALSYRNSGSQPIADAVFDNPVPVGIAYRAAAPNSPAPLLSVDGKLFGPLDMLRVAGRPATIADVTHVRWIIAGPIAPGTGGRLAFAAVLK